MVDVLVLVLLLERGVLLWRDDLVVVLVVLLVPGVDDMLPSVLPDDAPGAVDMDPLPDMPGDIVPDDDISPLVVPPLDIPPVDIPPLDAPPAAGIAPGVPDWPLIPAPDGDDAPMAPVAPAEPDAPAAPLEPAPPPALPAPPADWADTSAGVMTTAAARINFNIFLSLRPV